MQKLLPSLSLPLQFCKLLTKSHDCVNVLLIKGFSIQQRLDQTFEIGMLLVRRVCGTNLELIIRFAWIMLSSKHKQTHVIEVCSVHIAVVSSKRRVDNVVTDCESVYDRD